MSLKMETDKLRDAMAALHSECMCTLPNIKYKNNHELLISDPVSIFQLEVKYTNKKRKISIT